MHQYSKVVVYVHTQDKKTLKKLKGVATFEDANRILIASGYECLQLKQTGWMIDFKGDLLRYAVYATPDYCLGKNETEFVWIGEDFEDLSQD